MYVKWWPYNEIILSPNETLKNFAFDLYDAMSMVIHTLLIEDNIVKKQSKCKYKITVTYSHQNAIKENLRHKCLTFVYHQTNSSKIIIKTTFHMTSTFSTFEKKQLQQRLAFQMLLGCFRIRLPRNAPN